MIKSRTRSGSMVQQAARVGEPLGPVLDGERAVAENSRAGCDETAYASAPWARQNSKNWLEKVRLVSLVNRGLAFHFR